MKKTSKKPPKKMCLACGKKPAVITPGTLPLCEDCSEIADQNKGGVRRRPRLN